MAYPDETGKCGCPCDSFDGIRGIVYSQSFFVISCFDSDRTFNSLSFAYGGKTIRASIDGKLEELERDPVKHKHTDPSFTEGGPGGKGRGMNP